MQVRKPAARRSGARNALTLMIGSLASRMTGFVRQAVLVTQFPKEITDAFLLATRVPNLFRELLAEGAITNAFIPVYKALPKAEAKALSSAMLGLLLGVNALLTAVCILLAPAIVGLLLQPGANVNAELTIRLTRIVFPFLASISLSALAQCILNAEERFFAPAWAPVALNAVTIMLMLLFPGQANVLAVSFVIGGLAQLLVQLPALSRYGLLPRLGWWWHRSLPGVLVLMVPFTFTTSARQFLNVIAARALSVLPPGSVTAFDNANLVFTLALSLFSVSPALAFYSRLSADAAFSPHEFRKTLLSGLKFISFLTIPSGLIILVLAEPAIRTLFAWGDVDRAMLVFSVQALAPLGLAVFPWGVNNLLIRPFYVRRKVRAPILISVIFISLNALLYALLAPRYGLAGMSWGTVTAGWLQFGVLLYWMRRDEALNARAFLGHALKVFLAAGNAAGIGYVTLRLLPLPGGWGGAMLSVLAGGAVITALFTLFCLALALPELQGLIKRLRH